MPFVAREGTVADADGTVHVITPGALLFVADGWSRNWELRNTVRKGYANVTT